MEQTGLKFQGSCLTLDTLIDESVVDSFDLNGWNAWLGRNIILLNYVLVLHQSAFTV